MLYVVCQVCPLNVSPNPSVRVGSNVCCMLVHVSPVSPCQSCMSCMSCMSAPTPTPYPDPNPNLALAPTQIPILSYSSCTPLPPLFHLAPTLDPYSLPPPPPLPNPHFMFVHVWYVPSMFRQTLILGWKPMYVVCSLSGMSPECLPIP